MNLEVTEAAPAQASYDLSDWLVLILAVGCFVASWAFVFLHPTVEAFGICIGGTVTNGGLFHLLRVHDDKQPDRKDS